MDLSRQLEKLQQENAELKRQLVCLRGTIDRDRAAQEQFMRLLLENSPNSVFLLDENTKIAYCTKTFLKIACIADSSEIAGQPIRDVLCRFAGKEDAGRDFDDLYRLAAPAHRDVSWSINNKLRHLQLFYASAECSEMDFKGSIFVIHDITDIKELQIAAEKAAENVAIAGNAKSTFLANMSHAIRTPLSAITGMTQIGLTAESEEQKDYCLIKVNDASKYLIGVINDVLDMLKINAGKFSLSYTDVLLDKTIANVTNIIKFRIQEKAQVYTVDIDENLPECISADELRLNQVLTNLLSNAVKFTPELGTIVLKLKLLSENNGICEIQFTVSDNGIGITPEQQEQLFQSFEQTGNAANRKFGGTGLGLAISKQIIDMMGGRIWVESIAGSGSVFAFTIQASRKSSNNIGSQASEKSAMLSELALVKQKFKGMIPEGIFKNMHILVAEDVKINREIVKARLKVTGVEIDFAENGLIAVEKFKNAPAKYDLIFMDMQMPEMDGLEAAAKIRALPNGRAESIPIIAMTANVFQEDIDRCIAAGMNDHIGKPLDIGIVIEKMQTYAAGLYLH